MTDARAAGRPEIALIVGAFPHGRTRGEAVDYVRFHAHKLAERLASALAGRPRRRPHRTLLAAAVGEVLGAFPDPLCVETGCIRNAKEGTDSTLVIAQALERAGRGRLLTFELQPKHVEVCRAVCRSYEHRIEYVLGDSTASLRRLSGDGTLPAIHFAFFDSANDPEQIWSEFETVEDRFLPGSIVIVDDTVPPSRKGRRIKPYLHRNPAWETWLVFAGRGLLVAAKRGERIA